MLYGFVKRGFDILFSVVMLIVSSPIWFISIIGILISDKGPIFHMANRAGKDNKSFSMFKFRSMRVDNSANERSLRADKNRIFPYGTFMRLTKIDELPQILNVLIGHMSVVGPRPAAADQVKITRGGKYMASSSVKPGLTSPSAIYDYLYGDTIENETEYNVKVLPTRLELDLFYINHCSLWYDFKMIVYTAICIFCTVFGHRPEKIYSELVEASGVVNSKKASSQAINVK